MTLMSLRKFLPMMKSSSPPLTEQLWSDFFRISGSPAGWAVDRTPGQTVRVRIRVRVRVRVRVSLTYGFSRTL